MSNCPLKMGPKSSPETSVSNHLTPRNNPEEGRIQFNRGGSLRYCILFYFVSVKTCHVSTPILYFFLNFSDTMLKIPSVAGIFKCSLIYNVLHAHTHTRTHIHTACVVSLLCLCAKFHTTGSRAKVKSVSTLRPVCEPCCSVDTQVLSRG